MVTKEAAIPVFVQPAETLSNEQNSFAGFIDGNRELFQRHAELTYELRDEEKGWRNSTTIEELVEIGINVDFSLNPYAQISSKNMRKMRERVRKDILDRVFGNQEESSDLYKADMVRGFSMDSKRTPRSRELEKQLTDGVAETRQAFHEIRDPIAEEVKESRGELHQKLKEFLLSHPLNIFNFRDFLADKKQGQEREAIKPFLISLVQSEARAAKEGKPSILAEAVTKWTEELVQNPSPKVIDEFSLSIRSPKILEWLGFAADYAGKSPQLAEDSISDRIQRISAFLKTIDFKSAPSELRGELAFFISDKYTTALGEIRKELGNFNPPLSLKTLVQPTTWTGKGPIGKKHPPVNDNATEQKNENKGTKEPEKREKYTIGALRKELGKSFEVRIMTDSELADMIKKEADVLDSGDPRMQDDLKKILDSLREDPYGGIKKLRDRKIVIGVHHLSLRSFNPGKRVELKLLHPESARTRIVFATYRNGGESGLPTVVIEGIYKHEDYDRKFVS